VSDDGPIGVLIDHQAELNRNLDRLRLEVATLALAVVGLAVLLAIALQRRLP
jgi:hypothetical protein